MKLLSGKDEIRNLQIINEQMFQKNQEIEEQFRNLAAEIEYQELRSTDTRLWGHLYRTTFGNRKESAGCSCDSSIITKGQKVRRNEGWKLLA